MDGWTEIEYAHVWHSARDQYHNAKRPTAGSRRNRGLDDAVAVGRWWRRPDQGTPHVAIGRHRQPNSRSTPSRERSRFARTMSRSWATRTTSITACACWPTGSRTCSSPRTRWCATSTSRCTCRRACTPSCPAAGCRSGWSASRSICARSSRRPVATCCWGCSSAWPIGTATGWTAARCARCSSRSADWSCRRSTCRRLRQPVCTGSRWRCCAETRPPANWCWRRNLYGLGRLCGCEGMCGVLIPFEGTWSRVYHNMNLFQITFNIINIYFVYKGTNITIFKAIHINLYLYFSFWIWIHIILMLCATSIRCGDYWMELINTIELVLRFLKTVFCITDSINSGFGSQNTRWTLSNNMHTLP